MNNQVKLGTVVSHIKRGATPTYSEVINEFPVLNQKAIRWGSINQEHLKYAHPDSISSIKKDAIIRRGDVVINSTGDGTIGRAYCFSEEPKFLVADSHISIIRTDPEVLDPNYLVFCFESAQGQHQIYSLVNGTTGQIELPPSGIKGFKLNVPPIEVQRKVVALLLTCNKEQEIINQQLSLLQQQKKGLMQRLLTGQAFTK